jgi:opacity protein-like surface antigen
MKQILAVLVLLTAGASPALAQNAPSASLRGFGGVSFMSETGGAFGGGIGLRVSNRFEVFGEIGRLTNMLPRQIQRDLDEAARAMRPFYADGLTIDGRAPAVYGFGGLRASRHAGMRLTLFADAGAGMARGTSDIRARAGGRDVSASVRSALRIKDAETRALIALGGGVVLPLTERAGLELGYRYMRVFTDDPRINTGTMSAAFRWGL